MTQSRLVFIFMFAATAISVGTSGCHRGYYRRMADADAKKLVEEKAVDIRWQSASGEVDVAPESRMFNPFSQDHPPIPPDDSASNEFMNSVDGRPGYPHWHANGDTNYVENPEWMLHLPKNDNGEVEVDFYQAFDLALLHSNNYQRQREELYLSALDVAIERFGFDSQFFSGFNSFFGTEGRLRPGGPKSTLSSSLGSTGNGLSFRKLGITGANFTVGLANSILWNFAGANTQSASSLINFSVIQPLMRGAGRDRIMESLTQAERNLLGNVRQMERFRQGFYLEVTVGRTAGSGLSRNGGAFLSNPTTATTGSGGLLGLLQSQQRIRNQENNVRYLEDAVEQFREFYLRDRTNALQVKQTETTLFDAQSTLLGIKTNYQNDLDRFKQTLGLPPNLPVVITDEYLDRFRFISDTVQSRQRRIIELRRIAGDQINAVALLLPLSGDEAPNHEWSPEIDEISVKLAPFLEQALNDLREAGTVDRAEIEIDLQNLATVRPERVAYLAELRQSVAAGEILADIDPGILKDESIPTAEKLTNDLNTTLDKMAQVGIGLETLKSNLMQIPDRRKQLEQAVGEQKQIQSRAFYEFLTRDVLYQIADQLTQFNNLLIEVSLTQALARSNSIGLTPVDIDSDTATQIARCFRLDWMNARAALVDNWRQIEFVADQLESQFDLVLEGNVGNVGDNPFRIRYETGQLRGGFRFDSPIVRMAERNQYRDALIRYQRARRSFYLFEDEISRNLRLTLRTIDLNKIQFELGRRNVQTAIEQFEISRLTLDQPARAGGGGAGGAAGGAGGGQGGGGQGGGNALGATAARDLTGAIQTLQRNQDSLLNFWINYEVLRRGLDYDLGTMMLDDSGRWIDPGKIDREIGFRAAAAMGLDPSCLDSSLPENLLKFEGKSSDRPAKGSHSLESR